MNDYIDWPGQSGRLYRYLFVDMFLTFPIAAGNYNFVRQLVNGNFIPLYFGETGNFNTRMPRHEVWEQALRLGATHAMAHSTLGGVEVRRAEEQDLIARWNPPLNSQHRTAG